MSPTSSSASLAQALEPWPADGLERVECCPNCGASQRLALHDGLRDRIPPGTPGEWTLWRCAACACAYPDPRPSPSTIGLAYLAYHTHEAASPASAPTTRVARVRRSLANGYRNWRYGAKLSPATPLGVPVLLASKKQRALIDLPLRYLPRLFGPGRVLDVGCGNGQFLRDAREIGWDVQGCDPDQVVVTQLLQAGFDVREGGIEAWEESDGQFDAITFSHVIEHLHKPNDALSRASALLRSGGTIYVETPNLDSLGHEIYGRSWRGLEPPRHLLLYTRAALRTALGQAGFERITDVPRPNPLAGLAEQSIEIARSEGRNLGLPSAAQLRRGAQSAAEAEFIAVVGYKR